MNQEDFLEIFNPIGLKMDQSATALGITLIGVVIGIAVTIVIGISGLDFWERVILGIALTTGILLLIKLLTQKGTGPLSKLARWTVGV
jgi:hypothetical protein